MTYRSMRWMVFFLASAFTLVTQAQVQRASGPQAEWLWIGVQLLVIFLFTYGVFRQLETMDRRVAQQQVRSHTLFESSGLGILIINQEGLISEANRSAALLTGWDRGELIGRKACSDLFACQDMLCAGLCPQKVHHHSGPDEEGLVSLTIRHKSGRAIPVMASVAPLDGYQPGDVAYFVWDVSERVRLEGEAAKRRRQAEGLTEIGREMAAFADLNRNMGQVLNKARDLFGLNLVAWGTLDEENGRLTWHAARGLAAEKMAGAVQVLGDGPLCDSLRRGRTFVGSNLAAQPPCDPEALGLFRDPDFRHVVAVPFRVRENSYGVLLGASTHDQPLTDEELYLFTHLAGYVATAAENGYLLEEIQHMATLEERQRLAREMHDSFGQTLTYLGMRIHMIGKAAQRGDTELILRETADLRQVLQETHTEVRRSIFQLKESSPPHAPMSSRWEKLLKGFEERTGIQVHLEIGEGALPRLPEGVQAQLTRVLQEALANVRNHAGADSVTVRIERTGRTLHLRIQDDGCGFDPERAVGPAQHHFGLSIMKERAAAIGAQFELQSRRGEGTILQVQMPLTAGEG